MLLERLRQESRSHHLGLEEVVGLSASLEEHQTQLRGFFGFVEPWEKKLTASPHGEFLSGREKTPLLLADLRHAGLGTGEIATLPRCTELPSVENLPAVLGGLYVFEGSTLGGQLISRHLEKTLGLSEDQGYRYFRGYGADTPARWQEFRQALLAHSSPRNDDLIVAAAQNTFSLLHRWFAPVPVAA